jgi:phage terminase small subunit
VAVRKPKAEKPLTERDYAFVDAYLGEANEVAWKAAEIAGSQAKTNGSLRVMGHKWLTKVNIQAEIRRRIEERKMGRDMVIALLSEQARASLYDFAQIDEHTGVARIDHRKAKKANKGRLLKKMTTIYNEDGKAIGNTIEMVDAHKALVALGRMHGLFEKVEKTGDDEVSNLTLEQADKVIAQYLKGSEDA